MTAELTREEVEQRVALLRRLKATLAQQRAKFQSYLQVLDAEKASLAQDDVETLRAQVELEDELVLDIHAIQKVIDPLEAVLHQSYQGPDDEVADLRSTLASLQVQVAEKSRENRSLLSRSMELVNRDIQRVRPQVRLRSPYGTGRSAPTLVDITT